VFKALKLVTVFFILLLMPTVLSLNIVFAQEATEPSTFNLSQEQKDPAAYNILPLILDQSLGKNTYDTLLTNMVSDQGYEAHCASEEWVIDVSAWGDIVDYFAEFPNTIRYFSGTSPQNLDLENARIPLLRGMEDGETTDKNDSFEGMFGANLHEAFTEADYTNATGVAGRLLSSYWQCYYKKNNLDVMEELCSKFFIDCLLN